jgi:hypothetical protein
MPFAVTTLFVALLMSHAPQTFVAAPPEQPNGFCAWIEPPREVRINFESLPYSDDAVTDGCTESDGQPYETDTELDAT